MRDVTLATAQAAERLASLRVKFAAMNYRGDLVGDAHDEYLQLFDGLPGGWVPRRLGLIETRTEASRQAWHVSDGDHDIVAVEHETGVEIILLGAAANVLGAGVLGFIAWTWRRWRQLRDDPPHPKQDPSLVIEVPRGDGTSPPVRLVVPPPVSDDDIARYLRVALSVSQPTPGA